jgi:hypothetical protein
MLFEGLEEFLEGFNLGRDRRHLALKGIQRRRKVRHIGRILWEDVGRTFGRKNGRRLKGSFGNIPTCIPHESEKEDRVLQFFPK